MGEACGVSRWGLGEGREAQPAVTHGATQLLGAQIQGRWHTKSRDQAVGWGEVTSFFSSLLRTVFFYFLCHSFSCPLRISLSGLALPSSPPFFLPVPPSQVSQAWETTNRDSALSSG